MKRIGSMLSLLLVAAATHAADEGSTSADAASADAASADRVHVTENGNTVQVERLVRTGPEGGAMRGRDVTVMSPEGEVLGEGSARRFRTADGDTGAGVRREWTDDEGRTHQSARGRRTDADGNVTSGRARVLQDADGERIAGRAERTVRTAEGERRTVQRARRNGENGSVSGRRVVRADGNGNRTVRGAATRRSN